MTEEEIIQRLRTIYRSGPRENDNVMLKKKTLWFYSPRVLGRWYSRLTAEVKTEIKTKMPMVDDFLFQCEKRGGAGLRRGVPSYGDFRKFETLWKWFSSRYYNFEKSI